MVFLGWDPAARSYYTNVVDLCPHCDGWGEDPESDTFCVYCQAEGVNWSGRTLARTGLTLDKLTAALRDEGLALPDSVRADLEGDRRA
jgi:hypothetical protein